VKTGERVRRVDHAVGLAWWSGSKSELSTKTLRSGAKEA